MSNAPAGDAPKDSASISNAPVASIWRKQGITIERLNSVHRDTVCELMGMAFTAIGPDWLEARMPVDHRTKQPAGILHGGSSVTLAETLGSTAGWMCIDEPFASVGLEINANHVRSMREGWVTGRVTPVHVGRTTHIWQIRICDDNQRLVCTSRITLAIVDKSARG